MKIGAIVLAAGGSRRLGQPKQLLSYKGKTFVRQAVDAAAKAECSPVIVVTGRDHESIASELKGEPVEMVPNELWERGIGSSIRTGMALLVDADAVVILTCDQPFVDPSLIARLIAAWKQTGKRIVACTYANTTGIPALFSSEIFPKLLTLPDAQGAKHLIQSDVTDLWRVEFPMGEIDIDTPADYERLSSHA